MVIFCGQEVSEEPQNRFTAEIQAGEIKDTKDTCCRVEHLPVSMMIRPMAEYVMTTVSAED